MKKASQLLEADSNGSKRPIDQAPDRRYVPAAPTPTIKELPSTERPRERLLNHGPEALSSAELIALILGTGLPGESVLDLARNLLTEHGGLLGLCRVSIPELRKRRGLGDAKIAQLKALLELARRLATERPEERFQVRSPADIEALLGIEMGALETEQLRVVLLDTKNRVMGIRTVAAGSANATSLRVGEVFRDALRENSTALVVVHNHPSGDPTPSPEDAKVTAAIVEAGRLLDVDVLDHIVLGQRGFVSLREKGIGFSTGGN